MNICTLIFTYKWDILTMCALKYHVIFMCTLDLLDKCGCVLCTLGIKFMCTF